MKEEQMAADESKPAARSKREPTTEEMQAEIREQIPAGHQVVITSQRPDFPMLVTDAEHTDLENMGLLIESTKDGARLRQDKEN